LRGRICRCTYLDSQDSDFHLLRTNLFMIRLLAIAFYCLAPEFLFGDSRTNYDW